MQKNHASEKFIFFLVLFLQADDEEKPLISNDLNLASSHRNDSARSSALETRVQIEGGFSSPKAHGHFCKLRPISTDVQGSQGLPGF